mgnify:CR=1 FL=1
MSNTGKNMQVLPKKWFALYTRARYEKRVEEELRRKEIEVFLPKLKTKKQYTDRKKTVEEPLFKSYVFVKIVYSRKHLDVLETDGVVCFIKSERKPVVIRNREIDAVKRLIQSNKELEVTNRKFQEGEKVRIAEGPLRGIEGKVKRMHGKAKLQVFIDEIGQGLLVELHESRVKKLKHLV